MPDKKKHHWLHIATMDSDGDLSSPDADRWYWCAMCGMLRLNEVEYWQPPFLMRIRETTLPKGARSDPGCK